jgi:tryptophan halogenase
MIKKIVVVGGGTAGLVTAMILKHAYSKIDITIVESSSIGIIGVGEGTTEHWEYFMNRLGIPQSELVSETDATMKVGIKFINWNNDNKFYFQNVIGEFRAPYINQLPLYYSYIIANNIDPIKMSYYGNISSMFPFGYKNKQYHFDTVKLNKFLHKKAGQLGIEFIDAQISSVSLSNNGYVDSLISQDGNVISADFFIDASGYNRVIMKNLDTKWIDYSKYLPMNHAIAFQTPNIEKINAYTCATSMTNGWMWNIPTQTRHGNGYVFCDQYINADKAVEEVETMLGHSINVAKDIKFTPGRINQFMKKNCLAVGLSAMFVEPLEASSIGSTIQQAICIADMLTNFSKKDRAVERKYNQMFEKVFDNIVDFIQIHYVNKRKDSDFWREKPFELTAFNKETLPVFKHSVPTLHFFNESCLLFVQYNWTMVLYGLGHFDTNSVKKIFNQQPDNVKKSIAEDYQSTQMLNNANISHREMLKLVSEGRKLL